jgi:hypothetical protein
VTGGVDGPPPKDGCLADRSRLDREIPFGNSFESPSKIKRSSTQSLEKYLKKCGDAGLKIPMAKKSNAGKKLTLACLFFRERKIACGRPLKGSPDGTCNLK